MLKNFGWIREESISKLGPRTIRTVRHLERCIQTNWYAGSRNRLVPRLPTNEHSPLTSREDDVWISTSFPEREVSIWFSRLIFKLTNKKWYS